MTEETSAFVWCVHCMRTYTRAEAERLDECPYDDCDGDTFIDAWDWSSIRDAFNEYPSEPVRGVVYPNYTANE